MGGGGGLARGQARPPAQRTPVPPPPVRLPARPGPRSRNSEFWTRILTRGGPVPALPWRWARGARPKAGPFARAPLPATPSVGCRWGSGGHPAAEEPDQPGPPHSGLSRQAPAAARGTGWREPDGPQATPLQPSGSPASGGSTSQPPSPLPSLEGAFSGTFSLETGSQGVQVPTGAAGWGFRPPGNWAPCPAPAAPRATVEKGRTPTLTGLGCPAPGSPPHCAGSGSDRSPEPWPGRS